MTYQYKVVDPRGRPVFGHIDSPKRLPVGRRVLATVDPHGHADPIFGRPGHRGGIWIVAVLQVVMIGLAIRVLLPARKVRTEPLRYRPERPPGQSRSDRARWTHDTFGD